MVDNVELTREILLIMRKIRVRDPKMSNQVSNEAIGLQN